MGTVLKWLFPLWAVLLLGFSAEGNGNGGAEPPPSEGPEEEAPGKEEAEDGKEEEPRPDVTLEELRAELAKTRKDLRAVTAESVKRKRQLREHEKKEEDRQKAEMSDLERANTAAQEWEEKCNQASARLDGLLMRQAFYDAAEVAEVQFVNAQARKDAFDLSDLSTIEIDEGEVNAKAMGAVIKGLQKSHPHLFGQATTPADIDADKGGKARKEKYDPERIRARYGIG